MSQGDGGQMDSQILQTIDLQRLGRELQRARKLKGMTQDEAAKIIGVNSRTTIVAIEQGTRRLKAGELIKLAEAYGSQVHDLVRMRPEVESLDVQFRGPFVRTSQDDSDIAPVIREFEDLCRNYLELEQLTESPLVRRYPQEYRYSGMPLEATSESIALQERVRLGLGDGPIPMLREVLEQDVGLRVFYLPMPRRFSEIYAYTDELGGCLAINRIHAEVRRRWSLAHGYFHFIASRKRAEIEAEGAYQRQPETERFADAFARYFLMPTASVIRRVGVLQTENRITPNTLTELADYYGVSTESLTRRLEMMHIFPAGMWERIHSVKWSEIRGKLGLGTAETRPQKLPDRYVYLAVSAYEQGAITEGELARFLGVDRLTAREIVADSAASSQPPPDNSRKTPDAEHGDLSK